MPLIVRSFVRLFRLFFNVAATTEIYTLSHTTLFRSDHVHQQPAEGRREVEELQQAEARESLEQREQHEGLARFRSEEHMSELQSLTNLVCRLLLEKKKKKRSRRSIDDQKSSIPTVPD